MAESKTPQLRFPEFKAAWDDREIGWFLERTSIAFQPNPDGQYREIGVRSHGRGLFHKDPVSGSSLGDKRVFHVVPNALVLNIVFAWEQAVAITTDKEEGFIASHRFPMFLERDNRSYLPFIRELLLTNRGRRLLEIASPGGAGRNKTLGQSEFLQLKVRLPRREEQIKIAAFLAAVDDKTSALRTKYDLLTTYKRGIVQKIFSRSLRFKSDKGADFPDWKPARLGDIADFLKGKGVSKADTESGGQTPCIRYAELYTSYGQIIDEPISKTSEDQSSLLLSEGGEVIVPASGESAEDIATFAYVARAGVALGSDLNVIRARGVSGEFLARFLSGFRRVQIAKLAQGNSVVHLYAGQLAQVTVEIPHSDEQEKICRFLAALDDKISSVAQQVSHTENFKKGLVQQMFA